MPRPNLLFVMTDQQKATSLDIYSRINSVETVALRQLADSGTTFDAAYCPYPLCVPSRISMLSGRYPSSTGYIANVPEMGRSIPSLFPHLHEHGYRTMLVGKDHAYGIQNRGDMTETIAGVFDRLYRGGHGANMTDETHRDQPRIEPFLQQTQELYMLWGSAVAPWNSDDSLTAQLSRVACDYLQDWKREDQPQDKAFAMWLSYPDPHEFYQAPRDVVDMIRESDIQLYPSEDADLSDRAEYIQFMNWYFNAGGVPDSVRLKLIRIYLAMCKNVDMQLLRVFDWLRANGQWENTLILFVSDHGDLTGELGLLQKFNCGYDGCCRVPFLMAMPGCGKGGQRIATPVNLADLPLTICDLLGIPGWDGIQSQSLASTICDGDVSQLRPYTVTESGLPGEHLTTGDIRNFDGHRWDRTPEGRWCYDPPHRFGGRMYAIRSEQYKLIVRAEDRLELFDMQVDPWETKNLAGRSDLQSVIVQHLQWLAEHQGRLISIQPGSSIAPQDTFYRAGGDKSWAESLAASRMQAIEAVG